MKKILIFTIFAIVISIILINISGIFYPQEIEEDEKQLTEKEKQLFFDENRATAWFLFDTGLPFELSEEELSQLKNTDEIVVIDPIFTQIAYREGGFYDYYRGECDEKCLTLDVGQKWINPTPQSSSASALKIFRELEWNITNDLEVHKNPGVLKNYKKIVLLHNEYVTKKMFDAITSHPNVIYLYPNSLYAQIEFNEDNNTITLLRGHSYPEKNIANGFGWEYDNTHPYEFDRNCYSWKFYEINNGFMLNCYPEKLIIIEPKLLLEILHL